MRWIAVSFKPTCSPQEIRRRSDTHRLFELAARFSPTVCWRQDSHQAHAGWLVEVESSFRLFGGAQALLTLFWQSAEELSLELQLANHSTATGAWWLSKAQPAESEPCFLDMLDLQLDALLHLPVTVLDTDMKLQATWQQCGFTQLADLWQLPRAGFLKRFGQEALAELDSGMGMQNRLAPGLAVHTPTEVFRQSIELPFHSDRLELIERHAGVLLQAVCTWLQTRKEGTRELLLTLQQAHANTLLQLRSAQPMRIEETWRRLLHHQLCKLVFDDDVRSIHMECLHSEPLPDEGGLLLPDPALGHSNWNSTCDVLRARLGEQTVLFVAAQSDPRPECSIVLQNRPAPAQDKRAGKKLAALHAPELSNTHLQASTNRPLWLLPNPRKLQGELPGWQASRAWQLLSGPERVEFGWWDSLPCKRDYYCARDANHSLVWLYQDLLDEGRWFLHGYFA